MNICVFGASSNAIDPAYLAAGERLGRLLAERGHLLVFGGGASGLMGAAARGVSEKNGRSLGIAPSFFHVDGVLYEGCTEFLYTDTMRERKRLMEERSDGFIMTPGGIGTFEEFLEVLTLKQLGRHKKPLGILNTLGYFDHFEQMLRTAAAQGFMTEACMELYGVFREPEPLVEYMEQYRPASVEIGKLKHISESVEAVP